MVLLRPPHMIKQYETKKVWLQTLLFDSKHNMQDMSWCDAEQDFYKNPHYWNHFTLNEAALGV